jgi:hypothetical protein
MTQITLKRDSHKMVSVPSEHESVFVSLVDFMEILLVLRDVWSDRKSIEGVHAIAWSAPHLSASCEFSSLH